MNDGIITLHMTNAGRSTGLRRLKEELKAHRKLVLTVGRKTPPFCPNRIPKEL